MKAILLIISVLILQADFSEPISLEVVDFSDDGKIMVGISHDNIVLMDTETLKIIDKQALNLNGSRNENVRISGDGQHLIFSAKHTLFYASIKNKRIKDPIKLAQHVWLDMEINYDGTEMLAAVDINIPRKTRTCSPAKRQIIKFWRNKNGFDRDTLMPKMEYCQFMSYAELLPNGGVIYQFRDGMSDSPHNIIGEAIPDGRSDWGYLPIYENGDYLGHQPMTENGDFLTYNMEADNGRCGLYITSKDANGNWRKSSNILPKDKDCQGPWFSAISPDGTKVAWLKYTRDNYDIPTKADIMITRLVDGKWTTPQIIANNYGLSSKGRQIRKLRISNSNLAFSLWSGQTFLCTRLDGDGTLHEIK